MFIFMYLLHYLGMNHAKFCVTAPIDSMMHSNCSLVWQDFLNGKKMTSDITSGI